MFLFSAFGVTLAGGFCGFATEKRLFRQKKCNFAESSLNLCYSVIKGNTLTVRRIYVIIGSDFKGNILTMRLIYIIIDLDIMTRIQETISVKTR